MDLCRIFVFAILFFSTSVGRINADHPTVDVKTFYFDPSDGNVSYGYGLVLYRQEGSFSGLLEVTVDHQLAFLESQLVLTDTHWIDTATGERTEDPVEAATSEFKDGVPLVDVLLNDIRGAIGRNGFELEGDGLISFLVRDEGDGFDATETELRLSFESNDFLSADLVEFSGYSSMVNVGDGLSVGIQPTIGRALSEPGDFNADGMFDIQDLDLLDGQFEFENRLRVFDLNGDSIVNNDDRTMWLRGIRGTWIGDANLDGEFNSADLILVFKASEFEDQIALNSNWADGDWDGDHEFTTSDLVAAFQDGGYEQGPPNTWQVPEPVNSMVWAMLLVGMHVKRQTRNSNSARLARHRT